MLFNLGELLSLNLHRLPDVLQMITDVGAAAGVPGAAAELVAGLSGRWDAVGAAVRGYRRPRVLVLEWTDPPFLPGH
ncbi:hypothetical protein [Pseudonocardia parietis]|uniref:ABC-type Fe3+-hydroxamate transport system substrate-binding protein n=1 Tax=Pseudonocardia parietis TaxID=570936 RepID=A0ABS4VYM9_9PSEU|nr:hypothetical protein [Pseudonocardia parietis]MBP2368906.1 ABC-type Fe3+-hydroxamate transport system substrate-binding protein [Pseudonocardia parietis]